MRIRKLEREEHHASRKLYEMVFSEDSKQFVDYYYQHRALDNAVWVAEDQEIRSMVHLNPVEVNWSGECCRIPYVVAVATQEAYRHKGWMRRLLQTSLQEQRKHGVPFAFLMPASESIYTPFGFRRSWEWRWEEEVLEEDSNEAMCQSFKSCVTRAARDCSDSELEQLARRVNMQLADRFTLFSHRSAGYYRHLDLEQRASGGQLALLWKEKTPVSAMCTAKETFPAMMARILDLETFVRHIYARQERTLVLSVTDTLFPENSGCFELHLRPEGSWLEKGERTVVEMDADSWHRIDISELPAFLGADNPFASAMICEVV